MKKHKMHRDTFILRIWWDEDKPGWTGQVQHVGTGESALIRSLDKLLTFVERRTGKLSGSDQKRLK
jgi:hypothetical protein